MHSSRPGVDSRTCSLATQHRFHVAFASYVARVLLVVARLSCDCRSSVGCAASRFVYVVVMNSNVTPFHSHLASSLPTRSSPLILSLHGHRRRHFHATVQVSVIYFEWTSSVVALLRLNCRRRKNNIASYITRCEIA